MNGTKNPDLSERAFLEGSAAHTVWKNVIPAMLATLMILIYNLADTFFIGQTHNDYMVAAVSLATPVFLIFMSIGTLFGVGGSSVISRALGEGRTEYARKASAFCTWASLLWGILFTAAILLFLDPIVRALGASQETFAYTRTYLAFVTAGGTASILSGCWSNLIRAEGNATAAIWGNLIGNILNIILDPVLILGMNLGVAGAGITTSFGNIVGALIYLVFLLRGKSTLSIRPRDCSGRDGIAGGVFSIGIPAALTSLLMSVSQIIANGMIAAYGDMAVAAYGIAAKIRMCFSVLGNGMGHGMQPVLGYCYGAHKKERLRSTLNVSLLFSLVLFGIASALCMIFAGPLAGVFLTDDAALSYGILFTRITLISGVFMGAFCILMSALQAIGAAGFSLIAAISRQGMVYLPLLPILGHFFGLTGLVAAQPAAEIISLLLVLILVRIAVRRIPAENDCVSRTASLQADADRNQ